MFSAIRKRVTYANVAMTLALVFAMSGGAYAAGKYLITSTKQISPKVLKSLVGKAGAPGAQGPVGPAGPSGAQGPAGANGKDGANGANGTDGTNGTSVTSSVEPAGANCKAGGSKFVAASGTAYACNGEKGKEGTFGGETLPQGKTLTGTFAAASYGEAEFPEPGFGRVATGVTFALPIPTIGLAVNYIKENGILPIGCSGNALQPVAEAGHLCIFGQSEINLATSPGTETVASGSTTSGFDLVAVSAAKGNMLLTGTWAVTAP